MTPLHRLTGRGRVFLALGLIISIAAALSGRLDIMRVGIALIALCVLSLVVVERTRHRLACARGLTPHQVSVGSEASSLLRITNMSRFPSGVLLVEDSVPPELGIDTRFVLDRLEGNGRRDVTMAIKARQRGRFVLGPVAVHLVDPFGLCGSTRRFVATDTLTVTPAVSALPALPLGGDWVGRGDHRARAVAAAGEDDVVPRDYRTGDELRRVHWLASARAGELMVRREEQPWRTQATIILDCRRGAHRGSGEPGADSSSFEWLVGAAASIGVHFLRRGYSVRLIDHEGKELLDRQAEFAIGDSESVLLDSFAVVAARDGQRLAIAAPARRREVGSGLIIALLGQMTLPTAQEVAALRTGTSAGLAIIANTSSWDSLGTRSADARAALDSAALLNASGWRAGLAAKGDDVAAIWQSLARRGGPRVDAPSSPHRSEAAS